MGKSATIVNLGLYDKTKINSLSQKSPWLQSVFPDDELLFQHIRDAINAEKQKYPIPPYNPYLYEGLLADVSKLLDQCLAYRRECASLEAQAVTRALDYDLFGLMSANDATLSALLTDTSSLKDIQTGQANTAKALGTATDGFKGLAAAFDGGASAANDAIANQTQKSTALAARMQILTNYESQLQLQHTTPGHALNYAERRGRVVDLIKQDVGEAYLKATAARAGLAKQLQLVDSADHPFPTISGDDKDVDFLDRLVLWTRETLRAYEIYCEDEAVFDLVVPIASPYFSDFSSAANDKVLSSNFATLMLTPSSKNNASSLISVDLKAALPVSLQPSPGGASPPPNVRLRGIGLSAGVAANVDATISWSAVVFLPDQGLPDFSVPAPSGGAFRSVNRAADPSKRPPAILGRIFPYRYDASPAFCSGPEIWNADPTAGLTVIYVEPMALQGAGRIGSVRDTPALADLKVHLRFAARPSKNQADWTAA